MGSSSGQVSGHKYHTSLILFIGNAIEKVLGINFDNRGWVNPLVDENSNALAVGIVNSPNIYGETEGGVAGQIHARYGSPTQLPVEFYSEYLAENDIPPLAYQHQSYLAFEDFYVGNSGYIKEMLLWPKRVHVKNDGTEQWYDEKAEVPGVYIKYIPDDFIDDFSFSLKMRRINSNEWSDWELFEINFLSQSNTFTPDTSGAGSASGALTPFNESHGVELILTNTSKYLLTINISTSKEDSDGRYESQELKEIKPGDVFSYRVITVGSNQVSPNDYRAGVSVTLSAERADIYDARIGNSGDISPIHKIREILTDRTAMNKPDSEINEDNFRKAADRIWGECLGVSWAIQEKSCIDAINELCFHIEAGVRINRQTGLYEMVLFRDDWFDQSEMHTLAENKIKSIELEVQNGYEVVNQLNVNFYDRENIKDSSFSVAENASIRNLNGKVNAETVDFPYFMNQRNAEIVSKWKLRQYTSAGWKGTFTTSEKQARKWNRYDIVKINWSRKRISSLPVRILSLKFGGPTSNLVTIEFEEVVSALGDLNTSIVIDDGIDNTVLPPKPCNAKVFELPYFEAVQANGERETNAELADNPEAGFICAIAEKPQNNSLSAALYVNNGNGFEKAATINYCETAYLEESINKIASSFVVKNAGDLASVRVGSQIFINDEIMVYQSFDAQTKVVVVKRGAFGVPDLHDADSILYFADDFVAIDQTLYVNGEQVEAKVLTTTPSGILSLDDADAYTVDLKSRAIRPYPPANVKINDSYYPQEIESDLVLTWVNRNRAQQTGGEILGWFDGGVMIESGVTYQLVLVECDENNIPIRTQNINVGSANYYVFEALDMDLRTSKINIELSTVKNGFICEQPYTHKVELIRFFSAPYDIKYTVTE